MEYTRKIGTHSRFGAHKHEVRNELYHSMLAQTKMFGLIMLLIICAEK